MGVAVVGTDLGEKQLEIKDAATMVAQHRTNLNRFGIPQEAMNTIAKHSQASLENLSLRKEEDRILLKITLVQNKIFTAEPRRTPRSQVFFRGIGAQRHILLCVVRGSAVNLILKAAHAHRKVPTGRWRRFNEKKGYLLQEISFVSGPHGRI